MHAFLRVLFVCFVKVIVQHCCIVLWQYKVDFPGTSIPISTAVHALCHGNIRLIFQTQVRGTGITISTALLHCVMAR